MNLAHNTCNIENALAITSLLWPEIVEVKEYIFVAEFYNGGVEELEKQFNNDKRKIEMFVNSWSLSDLLLEDNSLHKDPLIEAFGETIRFFWEMRFRSLFPSRNIIVEIGDEIMGERGLTVTVYQA